MARRVIKNSFSLEETPAGLQVMLDACAALWVEAAVANVTNDVLDNFMLRLAKEINKGKML